MVAVEKLDRLPKTDLTHEEWKMIAESSVLDEDEE